VSHNDEHTDHCNLCKTHGSTVNAQRYFTEARAKRAVRQDGEIKLIFKYLRELLNSKTEPMRKIGFKRKE
jgi:hypothetical protein